MRTRIAAAVAVVLLGVAAPVSSAMAFYTMPAERSVPTSPYGGLATGGLGVHDHPRFTGCPMSSASEGNANQQTRPVKQYGQTSGGYRC